MSEGNDIGAGSKQGLERWWHGLVPSVVALVGHGVGLLNGFVIDDRPDILEHPVVTGSAAWHEVLLFNYMGAPLGEGPPTIRPLTTLWFAVQHAVFGPSPMLFHAVSVGLYALCAWLVFRVARLWLPAGPASLTAAVWASLAIHVDAVAMVANSAEVLSLSLALLVVLLAYRRWWHLAMLAYIAAVLAKESALLMPALVLWMILASEGREAIRRPRSVATVLGLLTCMATYVWFRQSIVPVEWVGAGNGPGNPLFEADLGSRLWMPFSLLGRYLRLSLVPIEQSFIYDYCTFEVAVVLSDPHAWLGMLFVAGLLYVFAVSSQRRSDRLWRGMLVCVGGFVVSYILFSNVVFLIVTIFAERLFLGPSVWLCIAAGLGATMLVRQRPALRSPVVGVVVALAIVQTTQSAVRTTAYESNYTLARSLVDTWPNNVRGRLLLASELCARGQCREALWHGGLGVVGRDRFPAHWDGPGPLDVLPLDERLRILPGLVARNKPPVQVALELKDVYVSFLGEAILPAHEEWVRQLRSQP